MAASNGASPKTDKSEPYISKSVSTAVLNSQECEEVIRRGRGTLGRESWGQTGWHSFSAVRPPKDWGTLLRR